MKWMLSCFLAAAAAAGLQGDEHLYSSATTEGLTFYASFDGKIDADKAVGDPKGKATGPEAERFGTGIRNQGLRIGCSPDRSKKFAVNFAGLKNIDHHQGSISFWIKPEDWKGNDKDCNLFVTGRKKDGVFFVYKYMAGNLLFYTSEKKAVATARDNLSSWQPGEWHHITVTWDRQSVKLYVDGRLKNITGRQKEVVDSPYTALEVGFRNWEIEKGLSIIDELKVYNRVLTETEIGKEYAAFAGSLKQPAAAGTIRIGRKSPKIDGVIAPGEYAVSATGFLSPGGKFSAKQGKYHLAWDDRNLYIALDTPQPVAPLTRQNDRDGAVWLDDSVEVWLARDPAVRHQIIFNSKGVLYDGRIDTKNNPGWNLKNIRIANRLVDGRWIAEMAIPLAELGQEPVRNARWKGNFCRTYKSVKPESFVCTAPVRRNLGYSDVTNFTELVLDAAAPMIALESLGDINRGAIDFKLNASSPTATCEVDYATHERTWFREKLSRDKGGFVTKKSFAPAGTFTVRLQEGDKELFRNAYQGELPSPVAIQYIYTDIPEQKMRVVLKNEAGQEGGRLHFELRRHNSKEVVRKHVIPVQKGQVFWTEAWDVATLPPGDYDFVGHYVDADGVAGEEFIQWYRKTPKVCAWDDNQIGIYPGEVPAPWKALRADAKSVGALMQTYTFDRSLLPSLVRANERDILSRPCEVVIDGRPVKGAMVRLLEKKPDYVVYQTEGKLGDVSVRCRIRVEFDGMMWIDMTLNGRKSPVKTLWIDIPLKKHFAEQVHSNGGDTHRAAFGATGLVPAGGWHKNLYAKPAFWVGNDDAGIAWFAENLKGWRNADKNKSVQILPGKEESVIRLNVIDKPFTLDGDRAIAFGLQATPVKQPSQKIRPNRMNREWGWSDASLYFNYLDGGREFFDRGRLASHKKYYEKLKANRFFLYIASNGASPYCPEWAYWGKIWTSRPIGDYIIEYNISDLSKRNKWVWTYSCVNSKSFREFYLWQLNNVLKNPEWDIRNLYYDLVGPRMCDNAEHGCSWKDDDGNVYPTHNIAGGRDFHKRAYMLAGKIRPEALHLYHVTGQPIVPSVHSFCDAVVEGETFFGEELTEKETYFGILEPRMFRVAYNGQKWGYPTIFIPQLSRSASFHKPEKVKLWMQETPPPAMLQAIRHFLGYALVHDISIWTGTKSMQVQHDLFWKKQADFLGGWDNQVRFMPYWSKNLPFSVISAVPDRVMASAYLRNDRAMLVVMNDTDKPQPVTIGYPGMKLYETVNGAAQPMPSTGLKRTIPPQDFEIIFLKK